MSRLQPQIGDYYKNLDEWAWRDHNGELVSDPKKTRELDEAWAEQIRFMIRDRLHNAWRIFEEMSQDERKAALLWLSAQYNISITT